MSGISGLVFVRTGQFTGKEDIGRCHSQEMFTLLSQVEPAMFYQKMHYTGFKPGTFDVSNFLNA